METKLIRCICVRCGNRFLEEKTLVGCNRDYFVEHCERCNDLSDLQLDILQARELI